jgi:hypothetical protein
LFTGVRDLTVSDLNHNVVGLKFSRMRRRANASALAMASGEVSPMPLLREGSAIFMKLHPPARIFFSTWLASPVTKVQPSRNSCVISFKPAGTSTKTHRPRSTALVMGLDVHPASCTSSFECMKLWNQYPIEESTNAVHFHSQFEDPSSNQHRRVHAKICAD